VVSGKVQNGGGAVHFFSASFSMKLAMYLKFRKRKISKAKIRTVAK
jgi:hypothetical protein